MAPRADVHYSVIRRPIGCSMEGGDIRGLRCAFCPFFQPVIRRMADRSGLPKYNRARGKMIRHLHEVHAEKVEAVGTTGAFGFGAARVM